jgi:NADH-quinone oxidoreductase subunit L
VLAKNYLLMFIGWEGVGLASYLLIGYWFVKDSAASAGKKAFIVNRIGDFGFLIALFLMTKHFGSLDFTTVFQAVAPLANETSGAGLLTAIGVLLMVGAAGKSAQIPLYVWLPDAMEGPTPVSALIHAATMVTAGVYMVARSHVIFEHAPMALMLVAIIGTLTALFAATIGIAQTDIKKVLAYSTVSQLGYMFMACGVAAFSAGIFHLMTHAFFKGLLFLAAGSVIHGIGGEQDMRKMGGLRQYMPWTFMTMTIATFAIAGFPPLAGFFSKDEILWTAYISPYGSWVFWLIGVTTAFITSFYMFRLWFMTFFGDYRGADAHSDAHDNAHGSRTGVSAPHGEIHEHSRAGARRDAPGGRSVAAGVGVGEVVCASRKHWAADGGSGVEPGPVLSFGRCLFAGGDTCPTQLCVETYTGEFAAVCGDSGGSAGDQRNQGSHCGDEVADPGSAGTVTGPDSGRRTAGAATH